MRLQTWDVRRRPYGRTHTPSEYTGQKAVPGNITQPWHHMILCILHYIRFVTRKNANVNKIHSWTVAQRAEHAATEKKKKKHQQIKKKHHEFDNTCSANTHNITKYRNALKTAWKCFHFWWFWLGPPVVLSISVITLAKENWQNWTLLSELTKLINSHWNEHCNAHTFFH